MTYKLMYPGKVNSPATALTSGINSSVETIPLADASVLPDGPNVCTIGTGEDAETVLYTDKSGNSLTGCTRAFDSSTARGWNAGEIVARRPTAYDLEALQNNLIPANLDALALPDVGTGDLLLIYDTSAGVLKAVVPHDDHGALSGLADDDHERYFDKNGSKGLTGEIIKQAVDNSRIIVAGGNDEDARGGMIVLSGMNYPTNPGAIQLFIPNAAKTGIVEILRVEGATDTPVLDWLTRRHTRAADPTAAQDLATKNYVDTEISNFKHFGANSVADEGTIEHGLSATPTAVLVTLSVADEIVAVTAKSATTFTVAIKKRADGAAGTTQTVYWFAVV